MAQPALLELIEHIARSLVDYPNAVEVRDVGGHGDATVLELRVAKEDLGKVIGKGGATARAIRAVLFAAAMKTRRRAVLNIVED
jgi:predicted RNA-binding protein YlqC (UPF0109 family)